MTLAHFDQSAAKLCVSESAGINGRVVWWFAVSLRQGTSIIIGTVIMIDLGFRITDRLRPVKFRNRGLWLMV